MLFGSVMGRKGGGLAAMMSGQPAVVKKRKNLSQLLRKTIKSTGLHVTLIIVCILYVGIGAFFFAHLESPHEDEIRKRTQEKYETLQKWFTKEAEYLKDTETDDMKLNISLNALIDEYTHDLFDLFEHPVSLNYFDSLFYNDGNYEHLWNWDAAILFTTTTIIPVGFGLITPLTWWGRMSLCVYAMIGIPLALVTLSDISRFVCDAFFRLFKENIPLFAGTLLALVFLFPIVGGLIINELSNLTFSESIYYCCVTMLTVGYGDIGPPIPISALIVFIIVGVILVTIFVDIVAANAIHQIHFMGRQMGKAKQIAGKMILMAQKISINKGLGLGMAQLGAFAKMGLMINVSGANGTQPRTELVKPPELEPIIAEPTTSQRCFDPFFDFDLIDDNNVEMKESRASYDNNGFGFFEDEITEF